MKNYTRTDLACESMGAAALSEKERHQICREEEREGFHVTRLTLASKAHSERFGKPCGTYVTVSCGHIGYLGEEERERLVRLLSEEIRNMCRQSCGCELSSSFSVLVAALGNEEITADAIGPRMGRLLTATRHLRQFDRALYEQIGRCEISVLFTGVLGQTGMETVELVRGAAENVKPDLVLAVDALAARSSSRLAATVQLCDSGIAPGSGVGNHRKALSRETVGFPVLAIGVPTVVDSSTLVWDALETAGISEVSEELTQVLENGRRFFVTPKESDLITRQVAALLADAIDGAFCVFEG